MAVKFTNNARSTLAGSIGTGDLALAVASADAGTFPSLDPGDWFPLTIFDSGGNMEIVKVTARSGAALTIVRAQEGTTAKAFASGTRCELRPTMASLNEIYNNSYPKAQVYTKTETDTGFYSKAQIDTIVDTIDDAIADKQDALGYSPVNKIGDTMTGALEIHMNQPTIWLNYTSVKRARWVIDSAGNLIWQDQGGQNHLYITSTGMVWTQQFGDLNARIEARAAAYADDRKSSTFTSSRMAGEVAFNRSGVTGKWQNSGYVFTGVQGTSSGGDATYFARQPQLFMATLGWFAAFPF